MKAGGLTLIEVLIVLAILGTLITLTLGVSGNALKSGQRNAARNHSQQVTLAITQWLSQSPVRTVSGLVGLDCTRSYVLNASGAQLNPNVIGGQLGWKAPAVPMTCTIAQGASPRSANVTTQLPGDSQQFVNGERR